MFDIEALKLTEEERKPFQGPEGDYYHEDCILDDDGILNAQLAKVLWGVVGEALNTSEQPFGFRLIAALEAAGIPRPKES